MCVLLPNLKDYKTTLPIGSSNRQKEGSRGKKYKNLHVERKDCEHIAIFNDLVLLWRLELLKSTEAACTCITMPCLIEFA